MMETTRQSINNQANLIMNYSNFSSAGQPLYGHCLSLNQITLNERASLILRSLSVNYKLNEGASLILRSLSLSVNYKS